MGTAHRRLRANRYGRLYRLHQQAAFFLTRAKKNLDAKRRQSRIIDKTTGLRSDKTIVLEGVKSSQSYPEALQRIHYYDVETGKRTVDTIRLLTGQ